MRSGSCARPERDAREGEIPRGIGDRRDDVPTSTTASPGSVVPSSVTGVGRSGTGCRPIGTRDRARTPCCRRQVGLEREGISDRCRVPHLVHAGQDDRVHPVGRVVQVQGRGEREVARAVDIHRDRGAESSDSVRPARPVPASMAVPTIVTLVFVSRDDAGLVILIAGALVSSTEADGARRRDVARLVGRDQGDRVALLAEPSRGRSS